MKRLRRFRSKNCKPGFPCFRHHHHGFGHRHHGFRPHHHRHHYHHYRHHHGNGSHHHGNHTEFHKRNHTYVHNNITNKEGENKKKAVFVDTENHELPNHPSEEENKDGSVEWETGEIAKSNKTPLKEDSNDHIPAVEEPVRRVRKSLWTNDDSFSGRFRTSFNPEFMTDIFGLLGKKMSAPKLSDGPETTPKVEVDREEDDSDDEDFEVPEEEGFGDEDDDEFGFFKPDLFGEFKDIFKETKEVHEKVKDIKLPDITSIGERITDGWSKSLFKKPIWNTLADHMDKSIKTVEKEIEKIKTDMTKKLDNSIGCTICTTIVKFVKWEVQTVNASVEAIEKAVEAMCSLYPIKVATKVCDDIVDQIDEIIQMIEKGVEEGEICQRIGICPNTTGITNVVSTFQVITPTKDCSPLCKFMRGLYTENAMKTAHLWTAAKEELMEFCQNNKFKAKCDKLFYMFAKAERKLSKVMAKEEDTAAGCKCFINQPAFYTKGMDMCHICQQFEKGLTNDLKEVNESMALLADTLEQMCELLPDMKTQCMDIVEGFRSAFIHLEDKLQPRGVCKAIGFCKNDTTHMKNAMANLRNIFAGGNPFLLRGKPMGLGFGDVFGDKLSSHGCMFCKSCMKNLTDTFSKVEYTKTMMPTAEKELDMFCKTMSDGDETNTVCKTIKDGIEVVHQVIKKTKDGEETCKALGVC